MNLSEFYNAESNTATGPMKALPRKNLTAAEAPLMSFIHLRYNDMFVASNKEKTNPAPEQSLLTIMAIAIAKSQTQITQQPDSHHRQNNKGKIVNEADVHEFGELNECCPHHKNEDEQEEKTDLVPEQFQRKVRSIVGFIPLISSSFKKQQQQQQFLNKFNSSKSLPQSPQPRMFVDQQEEEPRETESTKNDLSENETNLIVANDDITDNRDNNISNDEPNFLNTIAAISPSPPSQEEFMTHWNNTIGKSFLRNTVNAVPMLPEVWVLIPFDTLVERFLFQYHHHENQHQRSFEAENTNSARCSNIKLEEDFALLVLKSSPTLRQRIVSHLIGQLRELPVSSVAVSCRIAVNVLSSSSSLQSSSTSSSFPKIIKDLEIEHEYFSVKSWLKGCNVEISGSCESGDIFWIYGSPHPSYGIVNSLEELLLINNNQKQTLVEKVEETKVKAEIKTEDEEGEKQLQELLEDEAAARMSNNGDDGDNFQEDEETRFSQPIATTTATSTNSKKQTSEKRGPVRRQRTNSGVDDEESGQLPNLEKIEDENSLASLAEAGDEVNDQVIEPRFQFFPFSFIHILNSRLFSASTINAVNNCNYCQDELIDRLSYKHTTIHLMRIAIPTLMSYGLNVKWIDNNYFHTLLLSRHFRDQQMTSSSRNVARKIILIGSVLKWLKQVFVLSQNTKEEATANNNKNNTKVKKEGGDQQFWISLRVLLFEHDDDNENQQPIPTSLKLSCCCGSSTGSGAKRWLAQFGEDEDKIFQLEPHQLRVNINEKKIVMTMYLSLIEDGEIIKVKKCVVVDI